MRLHNGEVNHPRLPERLTAADAVEQRQLELGGALVALRRRGYAWVAIARAVERPLPEVRALAHLYAQRAAAEFVRDELTAD